MPRQCREQDLERVMLAARRAGYRRGISRLCFNRSSVAGIADSVANETRGAVCCPLGPRETRAAVPLPSRGWALAVTHSRVTRQCRGQDQKRVLPAAGAPATAGGYRAVAQWVT